MPASTPQLDPNSLEAIAKDAEARCREVALPTPVRCPEIAEAQNRLDAAVVSVRSMLLTMELVRGVDRTLKQKETRGRLTEAEVDALRAVVAFAGAGLDSSLKELIRLTIRSVSRTSDQARKKFETFTADHLAAGDRGLSPSRLAGLLTSPDGPSDELLRRYERELTNDSLQSADQVSKVCGALGIDDPNLRKRLKENGLLDQMFKARNQIIHELDLSPTGRRARRLEDVTRYAQEALGVTQEVINAVGDTPNNA